MIRIFFLTYWIKRNVPISYRMEMMFRLYVTTNPSVKYIENIEKLNLLEPPVAIIANYPHHFAEYAIQGLMPHWTYMLGRSGGIWKKFFPQERILLLSEKNAFKETYNRFKEIKEKKKGVFTYFEKPGRKTMWELGPTRTGVFEICHKLNIPIVLISVDHLLHQDGIILKQNFRVDLGPILKPTDSKTMYTAARTFFNKQLDHYAKNKI